MKYYNYRIGHLADKQWVLIYNIEGFHVNFCPGTWCATKAIMLSLGDMNLQTMCAFKFLLIGLL